MRASTRLGQRLLNASLSPRPLPFAAKRLLPAQTPLRTSTRFAASQSPILSYTQRFSIRHSSTQTTPPSPDTSLSNPSNHSPGPAEPANPPPSYQLTFTCKPCSHRSTHRITKQGYHRGTVLITCPSCKNRHVISDNLKIFMDDKSTLEDILRRKAGPGTELSKLLKKGRLGMREGELVGREGEEDIEFWDDGTESTHKPN